MPIPSRAFALFGILLVLIVACVMQYAHAQAPPYIVQHNGQQAFSANALQHDAQSPVYNFCDTPAQCGSTPPPIPPNDPLAMNTIIYNMLASGCAQSITTTGQDFWQTFGRPVNYPASPIIPVWPGYIPTNIKFTIAPGKRFDGVFSLPMNPGTRILTIKFSGYANCGQATAAYIDVSLQPVFATTPAPVGTCTKHAYPDNNPLFPINPIGGTLPPRPQNFEAMLATKTTRAAQKALTDSFQNPTQCGLVPGGTYRWIAQPSSGGALTVLITSSAT